MDLIMKQAESSTASEGSDEHGKHAKRPPRTPRRWLRVLLPAILILAWLTGAAVGGPYFGKLNEVTTNYQTTYQPESTEPTQIKELKDEFTDSGGRHGRGGGRETR